MEVLPFVDEGLGNSSYLIGLEDGRALAVDPWRDPGPYLAEAERRRWRISHVLETHLHADFVSGGRELAAQGARLMAPAQAGIHFPHRPVGEGEALELDGLQVRAIPTPGHAPEHLAYLFSAGDRPLGLFSGGVLLVGGVARPDLLGPEWTEEMARALFRSLHGQILSLPDHLPVYPTHGSGSFCTAGGSTERTTTIGREREGNPLLAIGDEDEFVAALLGGLGSYPGYFSRLREVNRRGAKLYGRQPPPLAPLDAGQVRRMAGEGGEIIDVRPIADYAAGHVPGSLSIALRGAFASWLGWLVSAARPLIFVLGAGQDRGELVRQCLKVGYENLAGELEGGMEAWRAGGLEEARVELVAPGELGSRLLLDVRQESEHRVAHIPGAVHLELGSLPHQVEGLPSAPFAVHCGHGQRAMTAASLLERGGRRAAVMRGGPDDWSEATGRLLESET
ncbi:MAG: MBL fold metallo-hydrolase [Actinomycetota bacterium]|nr:MBL fold metallo-hydrolase [Actinomycetota bacterium]